MSILRIRILGGVVGILFVSGCAETISRSQKGDTTDQQTTAANQPTPRSTAPVQPPPSTNPDQPTPAEHKSSGWNGFKEKLWDPITWFTFGLLFYAIVQARILRDTHTTNKIIERAYVSLSHYPPGLQIPGLVYTDEKNVACRNIEVTIGIKNFGNTPANVTYVLVQLFVSTEDLPEMPPYNESGLRRIWVSTLKGDDFHVFQNFPFSFEGIEDIQKSGGSKTKVYVLGYADYIDKFSERHRAGFARWYNPVADDHRLYEDETGKVNEQTWNERNNLLFVTQPHYNYDRPRKKGDGKDWDDPAQ